MRTIALILTTTTALTALTACSTEPLPEPVLETLTQETKQGMYDVSLEKLTDEVKYAMQAVKNEEERTAKEKSKGVSVNGMNVEVVGSFEPDRYAKDGYEIMRQYEVTTVDGDTVQCLGVESNSDHSVTFSCQWDK